MARIQVAQITLKKEKIVASTAYYYMLKNNDTYPSASDPGWVTTEPTYIPGSTNYLFVKVTTTYSDNTAEDSAVSLSSSYEAAKDAYEAAAAAQAEIDTLSDYGLMHGHFWWNNTNQPATSTIPVYPIGAYAASGLPNQQFNTNNSNTYGINSWISSEGFKIRYNAINLASLGTSALEFYYPSTSTQSSQAISLGTEGLATALSFYDFSGHKTMRLTSSALTFYGPYQVTTDTTVETGKQYFTRSGTDGNYTYTLVSNPTGNPSSLGYYERLGAATLNTNGLNIQKGTIQLGSQDSVSPTSNKQGFYVDNNGQLFIGNNGQYIRFYDTNNDTSPDTLEIHTSNFSIDAQGNVGVTGAITATSLTIGSDQNAYNGIDAINISGYSITIEIDTTHTGLTTNQVYLKPHLLHNGEDITSTVTDKTQFIWYANGSSIGTQGASVDGGVVAAYDDVWKVIYQFAEGAVGEASPLQQTLEINPIPYITTINQYGITVHPETVAQGSHYTQIDGNGLYIKELVGSAINLNNDNTLGSFTSNGIILGKDDSSQLSITNDLISFTNEDDYKLIDIVATSENSSSKGLFIYDGLGNNNANKIAEFTDNGVRIGKATNLNLVLANDEVSFCQGDVTGLTIVPNGGNNQSGNIIAGTETQWGDIHIGANISISQYSKISSNQFSQSKITIGENATTQAKHITLSTYDGTNYLGSLMLNNDELLVDTNNVQIASDYFSHGVQNVTSDITLTKSTGTVSADSISWTAYKAGQTIFLTVSYVSSASFTNGANRDFIFTGKYAPIVGSNGFGYYQGNGVGGRIFESNGNTLLRLRNTGSSFIPNGISVTFTYITEDMN